MRVDFTEWNTDEPGLLARIYTYSQLGSGYRDFEMEIHFDIQAGVSIFTFLTIIINNIDLTKECFVFVQIEPMDQSRPPLRIKMRATPNNYRIVLGLANPKDMGAFLAIFKLGKNMHFKLDTEDGETLAIFMLPNDSAFEDAYRTAYEKVADADEEEIGDIGVLGRVNRFLRNFK